VHVRGFEAVEFYVGSAHAVAYWHVKGMGFDLIAYRGPETGAQDEVSYVLRNGDVQVILTSALQPENHAITSFLTAHGDGVKRIMYSVDDVGQAFAHIVQRRGIPLKKPYRLEDEQGYVDLAAIKLYDDTEIVLVNRDHYQGIWRPGYEVAAVNLGSAWEVAPLGHIDHIVGNVRENEMDFWVEYFNRAFGFETFVDFGPGDIATEYSALLSKVVRSEDNVIKHPINEPYFGLKKSQIDEFIEEYRGTGVQHIALTTDNILETVAAMQRNGVEFLDVPDSYYDALATLQDVIREDISALKELKILVDVESEGYLLQIFTKPVGDRPTFFYEIIQRVDGAQGFGKGNFQALFEAIEREQERRGHL
jgi:4-hydroxyphenylpyruvate dioxygenase